MEEEIVLPEGWTEVTQQTSTNLPQGWSEVEIARSGGMPLIVANTETGIPAYDLDRTAEALGAIESSSNYGAVGSPVKGKRAYGKYQIMEQNIPEWSRQALGKSISLEEFKKSPELQDKIAKYKMKEYFNKGYSPQDVASMWLSGRPLKGNNKKDLATGISVPDYVKKFNEFYQNPKALEASKNYPTLWKAAEYINKSPIASKAVNWLSGFIEPFGDVAGGFSLGSLQGAGSALASTGNAAIDTANFLSGLKIPNIPHPDLSGQIPKSLLGQGSGFVGDIFGQSAIGSGVFKGLGAIPKLGNEASIFANALRGAGAGAITGEEGFGDKGQETFGGRSIGALLGGLLSPLGKLTNKAIADRILKSSERETKRAQTGFNDVFNEAPEDTVGIDEAKLFIKELDKKINHLEKIKTAEELIPEKKSLLLDHRGNKIIYENNSKNIEKLKADIEGLQNIKNVSEKNLNNLLDNIGYNIHKKAIKSIKKFIPKKERVAFDEYLKNPTIRNAHTAQSSLSAEIRNLKAIRRKKGPTPGLTAFSNALNSSRNILQKSIRKRLSNVEGLNEKYTSEKLNFLEKNIPYRKEIIELYKVGKKSPKETLKKLMKDYEFMQSKVVKKEHGKSLAAKQFLNALTGKTAGKVALGALGVEGIHNARNNNY